MSIPLDQLYHFIENTAQKTCNDTVVIYRYWPHGSKKIQDLLPHKSYTWNEYIESVQVICHDQEPLDFVGNASNTDHGTESTDSQWYRLREQHGLVPNACNLRWKVNIFDQCVLLHSEKRSSNLDAYQKDDYVPCYYWSHAMIAQDWFRYARHQTIQKANEQLFLIYNRSWTGTREYRAKFAEMLTQHSLLDSCRTWFNTVDPDLGTKIADHAFANATWKPNVDLEKYFSKSQSSSNFSAHIDFDDYANTAIEVVLETLFDDDRLHLTEKTLRPIACGQPFILAATHDSLDYLKSYGFQTFDSVWDESYDQETDPHQRLCKIIQLMKTIQAWHPQQRAEKLAQAQAIAEQNKKHFYSDAFFDQVTNELQHNLKHCIDQVESTNTSKKFFQIRKRLAQVPEIRQILTLATDHPDRHANPDMFRSYTRPNILKVISRARNYYLQNFKNN
jgi:hypothetical protein